MIRSLVIALVFVFAGCAPLRPEPRPDPPACDYSDVIEALEEIERVLADG